MKGGGNRERNYQRELQNSYNNSSTNGAIEDSCDRLFLSNIELQNIQPVISKYSEDDVLDIKLDTNENIIASGLFGIAGYIIGINSQKLIDCLRKGKTYKGTITEISSAICKISIRLKKDV